MKNKIAKFGTLGLTALCLTGCFGAAKPFDKYQKKIAGRILTDITGNESNTEKNVVNGEYFYKKVSGPVYKEIAEDQKEYEHRDFYDIYFKNNDGYRIRTGVDTLTATHQADEKKVIYTSEHLVDVVKAETHYSITDYELDGTDYKVIETAEYDIAAEADITEETFPLYKKFLDLGKTAKETFYSEMLYFGNPNTISEDSYVNFKDDIKLGVSVGYKLYYLGNIEKESTDTENLFYSVSHNKETKYDFSKFDVKARLSLFEESSQFNILHPIDSITGISDLLYLKEAYLGTKAIEDETKSFKCEWNLMFLSDSNKENDVIHK